MLLFVVELLPRNWPSPLNPRANTAPEALTAKVWSSPAATAMIFDRYVPPCAPPSTWTGVLLFVVELFPSCPASLLPQP